MNEAESGPPASYQVHASGQVRAAILALGKQAASLGIGSEFTRALDRIYERLATDPWSLGELIRPASIPGSALHVGSERPLTIRFLIDEERRIVFLLQLFFYPSSL